MCCHLQWDSMRKVLISWANLYGYGVLVIGDTIYARDGKNSTENACPMRGLWFGNFMRGSKIRMGVIKKQDFGVTSEIIKALLEVWDTECRREGLLRRREIFCLYADVVLVFHGCLRGNEVFLTSLRGMLTFWEETRNKKDL